MDFRIAIPARYAATRLPGKPLRLIAGEPLIVHTVRWALACAPDEVIVATDHEGIDQAQFDKLAETAKKGCPVSRLFNAEITLEATLEATLQG